MDPSLANPIILNTSINATLLQPQQPWWASSTVSTLITAFVSIFAVYLGQRMSRSAEDRRNFIKSRMTAYSNFLSLISDYQSDFQKLHEIENSGDSDAILKERSKFEEKYKDVILSAWGNALETAIYGNLRLEKEKCFAVGNVFSDYYSYYDRLLDNGLMKKGLPNHGTMGNQDVICISNLDDYITLLEIVRSSPKSSINIEYLFYIGESFFSEIREVLLNRRKFKRILRKGKVFRFKKWISHQIDWMLYKIERIRNK